MLSNLLPTPYIIINIMPIARLKIKGKDLTPQKAIKNPLLGSKNVLTNSRWEFVALWLKKEKKDSALFYWNQANEFYKSSVGVNIYTAPLLHYYCFMNATKALLTSKNIIFNHYHGVKHSGISSSRFTLQNEGIEIKSNGILPSLSTYFNETETSTVHSLQEIFFNLQFIHRTYCLSYPRQTDMFIPVKNVFFYYDLSTNEVRLYCELSEDFSNRNILKRLPSTFIFDRKEKERYFIKSNGSTTISNPTKPSVSDINNLINFNEALRKDLVFINGSSTLWYIKSNVRGPAKIDRKSSTLTLGAMHRLSELCRYKPLEFRKFMDSDKNWLINEFIQQSSEQFLDEIASEITGYHFLIPNIRSAK